MTVTATDRSADGYQFDHWVVSGGDIGKTEEELKANPLKFTMPDAAVKLTAVYRAAVTVVNGIAEAGTESGETIFVLQGEKVTVSGENKNPSVTKFGGWKVISPEGFELTEEQKNTEENMTFTMPASPVELKASYSFPAPVLDMQVTVKDGTIRGIDLYTLSNTGAYGEHGPTTVGLSGHKSIPLYGSVEAFRFISDVVYTNIMSAGAYRGYGATQGLFAIESAVNELADQIQMDRFEIRLKNMVKEGDLMPAYYNQVNTSCALDRCVKKVREMIGWEDKYPVRDMGNGKVRSVGMGMAMQGSAITAMDVGSARLKVNDEGFYTLSLGAADMGTGCDTILAQIAAEVLECPIDAITVLGADTDSSPYDSGSYASSTTYLTGKATERCALRLREQICKLGAELLGVPADAVEFDGKEVFTTEKAGDETKKIALADIATASMYGHEIPLEVTESRTAHISPPPFMAGAVELEIDMETGETSVINYAAAVDCGTPINPNLSRLQVEGGLMQGIGMALTENITRNAQGGVRENSLMQYKIPTRIDYGHLNVEFESSYEPSGPFGAKSIGEIVINTPLPAIADAVYNAVGKRFYELPITPEQIARAAAEKLGEDFI